MPGWDIFESFFFLGYGLHPLLLLLLHVYLAVEWLWGGEGFQLFGILLI